MTPISAARQSNAVNQFCHCNTFNQERFFAVVSCDGDSPGVHVFVAVLIILLDGDYDSY